MTRPRPIARRAKHADLCQWRKLPAGAGALRIDTATDSDPDLAHQREAAWPGIVRAFEPRQRCGFAISQAIGHATALALQFGYIEGDAKRRAASAA